MTGQVCAVTGCRSVHHREKTIRTSFFAFPKDVDRAKSWAEVCGRFDLLERADTLYKSHRLCAGHFEKSMFANHYKNRLFPKAMPTIFPKVEQSSKEFVDHNYAVFNVPVIETNNGTKEPLQELDINITSKESVSPTLDPLQELDLNITPTKSVLPTVDPLKELDMNLTSRETDSPPLLSPISPINCPRDKNTPQRDFSSPPFLTREHSLSPLLMPLSTVDYLEDMDVVLLHKQKISTPSHSEYVDEDILQIKKEPSPPHTSSISESDSDNETVSSMSVDSPTKEELWHTIKELQAEVVYLRNQLQNKTMSKGIDGITLEQYKILSRKFVPSEQLVNSICEHARQPEG